MKNSFFSERKIPILITLLIIINVTFFYFTSLNNNMAINPGIYQEIKLKSAFTPEGQLKIFALAKNNELVKLETVEGNPVPEVDSMIIGFKEAQMMKEENLFNKSGETINGLFGVDTKIEGILKETGSLIDDFHFLSEEQFNKLEGKEGKLFIKLKDKKEAKLFYFFNSEDDELKIEFQEGDLGNYLETHNIAGENYYPLILGFKEAQMMKEENLFSKPGDIIKGFFGKNVIIIGVMKETNTSLDMLHITSLSKEDFY